VILSSKTKAAPWSIEDQIELRDLFRKNKEEQPENIGLKKTNKCFGIRSFFFIDRSGKGRYCRSNYVGING
jgi:hypothetical protein